MPVQPKFGQRRPIYDKRRHLAQPTPLPFSQPTSLFNPHYTSPTHCDSLLKLTHCPKFKLIPYELQDYNVFISPHDFVTCLPTRLIIDFLEYYNAHNCTNVCIILDTVILHNLQYFKF